MISKDGPNGGRPGLLYAQIAFSRSLDLVTLQMQPGLSACAVLLYAQFHAYEFLKGIDAGSFVEPARPALCNELSQ